MATSVFNLDSLEVFRQESDALLVDTIPALGGKTVSIRDKKSGRDFLWTNHGLPLRRYSPGTEFDPVFYGGIDELLPNDIPEKICGIDCPDHGELWTTPLDASLCGDELVLQGVLPLYKLRYRKSIRLDEANIRFTYEISNESGQVREFLWKFHAALAISPGDRICCGAAHARSADPAYCRRKDTGRFAWKGAGEKEIRHCSAEKRDNRFFLPV